MFFLPFSPVSLTELCPFWYGLKDLFTLLIKKATSLQLWMKSVTHKGLRISESGVSSRSQTYGTYSNLAISLGSSDNS